MAVSDEYGLEYTILITKLPNSLKAGSKTRCYEGQGS